MEPVRHFQSGSMRNSPPAPVLSQGLHQRVPVHAQEPVVRAFNERGKAIAKAEGRRCEPDDRAKQFATCFVQDAMKFMRSTPKGTNPSRADVLSVIRLSKQFVESSDYLKAQCPDSKLYKSVLGVSIPNSVVKDLEDDLVAKFGKAQFFSEEGWLYEELQVLRDALGNFPGALSRLKNVEGAMLRAPGKTAKSLAQAERLRSELLSGNYLRDGVLDLSFVPEELWRRMTLLGPVWWSRLSEQGPRIASVILPIGIDEVPAGLVHLRNLERLTVSPKQSTQTLDLRRLPRATDGPFTVTIRCAQGVPNMPGDSLSEVRVPVGTNVCAEGVNLQSRIRSRKTRVVYFDECGNPGMKPRTLPGLIHRSSHTPDSRFGGLQFPEIPGPPVVPTRPIECTTGTMQWLIDRAEHRARKEAGEAVHFSYENYSSADKFKNHVSIAAEQQYERLVHKGADEGFESAEFGEWVAGELRRMAAAGEKYERIVLATARHCMGLELRVNPPSVVLYDFNIKNKHTRLTVNDRGELCGLPLESLVDGSDEPTDWGSLADQYFPKIGAQPFPRFCSVYRLPGDERARGQVDRSEIDPRYVSAEARKTPEFLYWALAEGFAPEVNAAMQYALDFRHPSELARHICSHVDGYYGPLWAFANGHEEALGEWISAVLHAPSDKLTDVDKSILLGRLKLPNNGFDHGRYDAVGRFAFLIANFEGLQESDRVRLLAPSEIYRISTGATLQNSSPDLLPDQHETIRRYAREIARATGLQMSSKVSLLQALGGYPVRTAAQAALSSGNPGAAAAMLCGINDGAPPSELKALLDALGVRKIEVLKKLAASQRREDTLWIAQLSRRK
jgi:hypothetical protein